MTGINALYLKCFGTDSTPIDTFDLHRIAPHVVTVGCAFGSIVEVPDLMRHQNESTEEFCTVCGYHHAQSRHVIPDADAVEVVKRIAAENKAALEEGKD